MSESIRSLLTTLLALEEQECSLKSELAKEESALARAIKDLANARNTMAGNEARKTSHSYLTAQADYERLKPQFAAAEARIAEINHQLHEARAAQNAITAGAHRVAVFVLAYQDAAQQADRTSMEFEEAVRKHEDATARREAAAARLATADQERAQALEPDAMAQARAVFTTAQADLDDAETLLANLARLLEERRARLRTTRVTVANAHQRAWKARYDDALDALAADRDRLHMAFAAGVAGGVFVPNYAWFASEVLTVALPAPTDLDGVFAPMAEALGVPARLPRFAPV